MNLTGGIGKKFCSHCGVSGTLRIGACHVCGFTVCESCGNVQYIKGEKRAVHNACLRDAGDSFSMIKFVK